jgi:hypothetical protein
MLSMIALLLTMDSMGSAAPAPARLTTSRNRGWPAAAWDGAPLSRSLDGLAASVTVDGKPLPTDAAVGGDAEGSRVAYQSEAGVLTDLIEPFDRFPNCFARRLTFENAKDKQRDLTGADLRVAPVAPAGAKAWQAQSFAMVECSPGGPTLCVAFTSDEDHWGRQLGLDPQPVVTHHSNATWRLPPGGTATIGTQYLWVVDGDLGKARASAQDWYDAVGLTVADGGPPWIGDCILYQACAGGSVDSRWGDCGGFDNFAKQLDFIADLGCNAFWLMSVVTHKDRQDPKGRWNLYDPLDFHQVDPAYGGEEGLTRLARGMRERGFRVFNEIVPSGGSAELCAQHPEWWTYGPAGERSKGFGHALDYSSPGWQATIRETIRWLTAGWGFDGYRVDVADGYGPNWKSPTNGAHVSLSTAAGSLGMLRSIRDGALAGGAKEPVVIPETIDNRPENARYGQLGYGFRLIFDLEDWFNAGMSPAELRQALTDYFENERGSLPRGMLSIRTINNHDTVVEHGRADRRFGIGLQRALMGVCCVVEGVPMIYHEQEVGSYEHFRRLFWGRRSVPEMCRGSADYLAVKAPPEVFAVLRTLNGKHAVGLVNLSPTAVEADLELPAGVIPKRGATLGDVAGRRALRVEGTRFHWPLGPYQTSIIAVGSNRMAPRERHRPESTSDVPPEGRLSVEKTEGGMRFEAAGMSGIVEGRSVDLRVGPSYEQTGCRLVARAQRPGEGELSIRLQGVDRWFASTETGLYEDRLLRRHSPWPEGKCHWDPSIVWGYEPHNLYRSTLPCGRQWQSAVAPLHPDDPRIGFAGRYGIGVVLRDIRTNAMNVVLTDDSEQPNPEPYGLTLRFVARDGALHPRWTPGYRRTVWTEVPASAFAHQDQPLEVSFVLADLGQHFVQAIESAPPPTLPSPGARQLGPGKHNLSWDRLWLIEPNTVTWTDLPLSADGDYTLWLQLRHSEAGPDGRDLCGHYQAELDGRALALEWPKLNVWSTGNGYFGWAKADLGALQAGPHKLSLTTTHTWCALHRRMYVSRDPTFVP